MPWAALPLGTNYFFSSSINYTIKNSVVVLLFSLTISKMKKIVRAIGRGSLKKKEKIVDWFSPFNSLSAY